MKKILTVTLILMIVLNLWACNAGGVPTETVAVKNVIIENESFTTAEFRDIVENNEFKFRNNYVGKTVSVTGKITKIESSYRSTNLNHYFEAVVIIDGVWNFEVSSDNAILMTADVGDTVTATGTISTSMGWDIYCYGNARIRK